MLGAFHPLKTLRADLRWFLLSTCFVVAACDLRNSGSDNSDTDPKITILPRTRLDLIPALKAMSIGPELHANRPFLFLIRETANQGLWLFVGAVRNPKV